MSLRGFKKMLTLPFSLMFIDREWLHVYVLTISNAFRVLPTIQNMDTRNKITDMHCLHESYI